MNLYANYIKIYL